MPLFLETNKPSHRSISRWLIGMLGSLPNTLQNRESSETPAVTHTLRRVAEVHRSQAASGPQDPVHWMSCTRHVTSGQKAGRCTGLKDALGVGFRLFVARRAAVIVGDLGTLAAAAAARPVKGP